MMYSNGFSIYEQLAYRAHENRQKVYMYMYIHLSFQFLHTLMQHKGREMVIGIQKWSVKLP